MNITEAAQKRYSCRTYQDKAIEKDKLDKLFEVARQAPSAKNLQDWRFVAVTDKQLRTQLAQAANNQMFIEKAGLIIVACSNNRHVMRCGQPIAPIDVAIALEHICLEATELGLATCWIGSFFPEKVRAVTAIPDDIEIIELLAVGYPADPNDSRKTDRLPIGDIVCYEKWQF